MRWLFRLAASAVVAAAVATCARPRAPVQPAARPTGAEPEVRVALVAGGSQVRIGGQGETAAVAGGEPAFRLGPGEEVVIRLDGRAILVERNGEPTRIERLSFVGLAAHRFVTVNGKPYRGVVDVYPHDGELHAVNRLGVDAYLQGVVSAEMGRRAPGERNALAAQAIVSRTYALGNRGRYASRGYDLTAGVGDQVYGGVAAEQPEGVAAVQGTRGQVLTYRGQPATVFFHSTCGFATASPTESFRSVTDQPYLRSVSDRRPGGGHYCDISPRFRWRVEWDPATLAATLRRTLPAVLGIDPATIDEIKGVRVAHLGPSGRPTEIRIRVGRGEIPVSGPDIRAVFRTPAGDPLGGSAVQLTTREDGTLVAAGAGWGHGVGMCQWGAVGRARAGQSTRAIVSAYFPGAAIERWF